MKNNCPFCNTNKEKSRILAKYKYCFVLFSNPRLMPGHLLVIPYRHVEKLSELNQRELNELIKITIKFQEKIIKNIAQGCDIRQNFRPFIKDGKLKVNHLHFHLQPRYPNMDDELYAKCQIHEIKLFKPLTKPEIQKILKLIDEK